MNICVLAGGISPERNVSLNGGMAVSKALIELGHDIKLIDPALGNNGLLDINGYEIPPGFPSNEELQKFSLRNYIECVNSELFDNVDVAFLVLHGINCEDGKIQSLLELRGIPYTGSKVKASSIAIDKLTSKLLFTAAGIPTPQWQTIRNENFDDYEFLADLRKEMGNDIVFKPVNQGSTIGITIINGGNLDDMQVGIKEAARYSNIVLAEKYIQGREITVGIVGEEALPVIEIIPEEGYYDYVHKYTKGKTRYECPADLDESLAEFTMEMAYTAFRVLDCRGFGRVDFRLDEDNQIHCLEVNTIPGFTATSLVPRAANEVGIEFPELCSRIIELAFGN